MFLVYFSHAYAEQIVQIGVVLDGPVKREFLPFEQIVKEIQDLTSGEFNILFPENKIKHGDWRVEGINKVLRDLLNDPEIDLIITNGLLSSHQAAQFEKLSKPVIASIVADRVLQELPYVDGKSGKNNYVYISDNRTIEEDLRQFHQLIQFNHLAIPVDQLFLEALPQLKGTTYNVQQELGFKLTMLPVIDSPVETLNGIPDDVDSVYVPPLLRFSSDDFKMLAQSLIERKLPGFSLLGREELEMGLLATLSGREVDTIRYARRIALYVQSILLGTNAADLKVELDQPPKLAINMRTARAINFSPKWQFLEIADLLYEEATDNRVAISMVEAIQRSVNANLALQVDKLDLELSKDDVANARSTLLPQLNFGTGVTQIDRDRAGLSQAQRSTDADVRVSQVIYSESRKSGYDVARLLEQAESAALRSSILDVISSSATAYLQLLSAHATEKVRRSNLDVTETNLELAESRLKIGYSDRSEVLRWQSQLATDRRNLYSARSVRDQAETELKRQLNMSLSDAIAVTDAGISDLLNILDSERFQRFFDNTFSFEVFTEFEVERAINNSPELEQTDFVISSNQRQLLAAERAYYVPDINLNTQYTRNIERGGLGDNSTMLADDQWSVGVQATIPIFAGGTRKAEVSRANNTLIQSRYQRENVKEQIEARVRSALQQANGSYPAIRLSKDAARAAEENLSLVIDAYSKGVVSITDLIDAQDATLAANLSAVEAQYTFMIDWIEIQRAVANFDLLLTDDGFEHWYQDLDQYYTSRNR
ncbi:MAG: TolC family protein [Proteobacteria bacterium]|nr:TolC family protein [Pseudomonadota bacterium]